MDDREFKAGAFSGLLAAILIVALSIMALTALQPQRDPPMRTASLDIDFPELPHSDVLPRGS